MASLVMITREGRLFLKVGGVIFGALMLIFLFVKGGALMRDMFFPKPPPVPLEEFGKLPHMQFPSQEMLSIQYTVNTINGQLPNLSDRVNIYKIITEKPSLIALRNTKSTLDSANFVQNQIKKTDTIYQWTQAKTGVNIEYDIVSKNFSIGSNYISNPSLVSSGLMPSEDAIRSDMNGFLQTVKANTNNLDLDKPKIELLQLENGSLVAAQNIGSARLARVTYQQKNIDEIPTVYGAPGGSILTFIISYPLSEFIVLEGQFYNHEADLTEKSDYPIKSAAKAYEDLKNGNAYIENPQNLTNVDITNVELKYYLTKANQGFLLPVIVFTGINFTAYVEALPESSLTTNAQ